VIFCPRPPARDSRGFISLTCRSPAWRAVRCEFNLLEHPMPRSALPRERGQRRLLARYAWHVPPQSSHEFAWASDSDPLISPNGLRAAGQSIPNRRLKSKHFAICRLRILQKRVAAVPPIGAEIVQKLNMGLNWYFIVNRSWWNYGSET
jgi:hypothetical protein